MSARIATRTIFVSAAALLTCACGGGGSGTEVASTPPPPSTGSTSSSTPVKIFAEPTVGEYGATGVRTNIGEWTVAGPSTPDKNATLKPDLDSSHQARIRYTAAGTYEVSLLGGFQKLIPPTSNPSPPADNPAFTLVDKPGSRFVITLSRYKGYRYSEMASWWSPDNDFAFTAEFGSFAFGSLTPAGGAPVTGTASYSGYLTGITDAKEMLSSGSYMLLPADGTIDLQFDFGKSTLTGNMVLMLQSGANPTKVGEYSLTQTVLSSDHLSYSGAFATALPGVNFFTGRFTGPAAQETIGSWAVPFTFNGSTQQAMGAWIAKR